MQALKIILCRLYTAAVCCRNVVEPGVRADYNLQEEEKPARKGGNRCYCTAGDNG